MTGDNLTNNQSGIAMDLIETIIFERGRKHEREKIIKWMREKYAMNRHAQEWADAIEKQEYNDE